MTTTPATTTWNIIDLSDGEVAGQAPGTDQRSALEAFRRDALNGAGTIAPEDHENSIAHYVLTDEGTRLGAERATSAIQPDDGQPDPSPEQADAWERYHREGGPSPIADLENGPSTDDDPGPLERADFLADEIHEAQLELQRLDNERHAAHDRYDETGADADILEVGRLSREAAVQRRHVRQLQRLLEEARAAAIEHEPAHPSIVRFELIDEENAKHGLPVTLDEAGDLGFATVLWEKAQIAIDSTSEADAPTNREVAKRVADAYATIWMGTPGAPEPASQHLELAD